MSFSWKFLGRYTLIILGVTMLVLYQIGECSQTPAPSLASSKKRMKGDNMKANNIHLQVTAEPLKFSISEIENFKISLAATNQGEEVIDPELHLVQLFINGERSMAWNLTISNGLREEKWFALPPGDTVSMSWSMGQSLFPVPGNYTLVPHYKDKVLDPIYVHVLP